MKKEKILCVDDEEMVVEALKMELMRGLSSDIVIETASNGEEALEIARETQAAGDEILLIISDQRMPGMTGEILLAELNGIIPQALKILLTGYTNIEAVQFAINEAGLYRYIQKPWDREDLILTVNEAIYKYRTAKKLEEKNQEIRRMNEELEKIVEIRTKELKDAVRELEAYSYTVSHDLKSPLRTIDCYSKFILEDYEQELNQDVKSMVNNIRRVCSGMFELIDKLLQYSLTSKAIPDFLPVNMASLIRQAFNEIAATEQGRNITLRIDTELPDVKGDAVLLKQVVHNLLSNAVKFTRIREKALITVSCRKDQDQYHFAVGDNGVGFDMAYAERLFGIFQRMHSQDEYEGYGIGLATVRKIIEKHGGRVSIFGEKDIGTTVTFSLPINQESR